MKQKISSIKTIYSMGFSLVELMVAMVVSLFLLSGIIQIYTTSSNTYRIEEALARLQESGRFAVDFIARDIRNIEFAGCIPTGISTVTNLLDNSSGSYNSTLHDFSNPLTASNGSSGASDTITIQRAVGAGTALQASMTSASAAISVVSDSEYSQNQIALISDCEQGDIFQITNDPATESGTTISHGNGSGSPGNNSASLSKAYGTDARVYPVSITTYSIASGVNGENSLFRSINGVSSELVDGVENIQFLYGADTNDDNAPDYFVPSNTTGLDLSQVISVRVNLLLSSADNITTKPLAYTYNGSTVTPADNRLRRVFTTTVALRNRLP